MIFVQNPDSKYIVTVFSSNKKWFLAVTYIDNKWWTAKWVLDNDKNINDKYIMNVEDVPNEVFQILISNAFNQNIEDFDKLVGL